LMFFANEIKNLPYKVDITHEFAPRERTVDYMGVEWILPDPDQVAYKLGKSTSEWIPILRFLQSDPHVWACCQSRKSGTLCREWEIVNPEQPGQNQKRANDAIRAWADTVDMYRIMSDILDAIFFGMAPTEVIWKEDGGLWLPDTVEGKPTEWFAFSPKNELRFLSRDHQLEGEPVPDNKILLPAHGASYYNPYGERVLSRCYWPITWKRAAQKFWAILTEKYGIPWVYGRVPKAADNDVRAALVEKLQAMVQDGVAVVNDDESIDFGRPGGVQLNATIFSALVAEQDSQISKAILGQTLTTDSGQDGSGSYALGKVHSDVRADLLEGDERLVQNTMDTLIGWIVTLNFPGAKPPFFRLHRDEDIQAERATRDKVLTEIMSGHRFTKEYFEQQYNILPDWLEEAPQPTMTPSPNVAPGGRDRPSPPPTPQGDDGEFAYIKKKIDSGGMPIDD